MSELPDPTVPSASPVPSRDLTRILLAVLLLGLLMAGCFWILRPFLPALVWATMIVVATWPLLLALQARMGGRRWLAALVMTLIIMVIIVAPVGVAVGTIAGHTDDIADWTGRVKNLALPQPPDWVAGIPVVGARAAEQWSKFATDGTSELARLIAPYSGQVGAWIVSHAGSAGMLLLHLLLTIALSALLYARGETGADAVRRFALRLAGERGRQTVELAGGAVRAVALGIVVTALTQSVLGGIGLAIVGIPYAGVLTALMFILCIAQLGPTLVLAPVVIWLFWSDQIVWGSVLLVWSIIVASLDNVLRPLLIRRGADLPLLLIMAGVIGGLLAFGIVGLFVGPVVLAVTYTLLNAWMDEAEK